MDGEPDRKRPLDEAARLPFLALLRVPGGASDPKRLVLAAAGLVLLHFGWAGLDALFPGSAAVTPEVLGSWAPVAPSDFAEAVERTTEPARTLASPFLAFFRLGNGTVDYAHAALGAVWGVIVWGLIGGAICRVAVVDVARHERVPLREALGFAFKKGVPLTATPLLPLAGVALVGALMAGFGLLYRLPHGATVAGALAFLPLFGGLILALTVVGLGAGWPLMPAAVAAQAEDGFDAMSRSYAYVFQRPWLYACYVALAVLVSVIGLAAVEAFAGLVVHMTAWAVSLGGPPSTVAAFYVQRGGADPSAAAVSHGLWLGGVGLLVHAWAYSAFWTAAAVIYLLLRRDVDGTPIPTISYQAPISPLLDAAAEAAARHGRPRAEGASAVPGPHGGPGATAEQG